MTEYRVENKYIVSEQELFVLSKKLNVFMQQDTHQKNGKYEVKSMYFDDMNDQCMMENESGIDLRKKYRIRIYDSKETLMKLEIKEKKRGFTKKHICQITPLEYEQIMQGGTDLDLGCRKPLNELILQMRCAYMRPKIVITYERTAFIYPQGNVRITFDRNIRASRDCECFCQRDGDRGIPVLPSNMHILEVKYDEFLPDVIRRQLENGRLQKTAFSKYFMGRKAINGEMYEDIFL